jgi:hypothetical protein
MVPFPQQDPASKDGVTSADYDVTKSSPDYDVMKTSDCGHNLTMSMEVEQNNSIHCALLDMQSSFTPGGHETDVMSLSPRPKQAFEDAAYERSVSLVAEDGGSGVGGGGSGGREVATTFGQPSSEGKISISEHSANTTTENSSFLTLSGQPSTTTSAITSSITSSVAPQPSQALAAAKTQESLLQRDGPAVSAIMRSHSSNVGFSVDSDKYKILDSDNYKSGSSDKLKHSTTSIVSSAPTKGLSVIREGSTEHMHWGRATTPTSQYTDANVTATYTRGDVVPPYHDVTSRYDVRTCHSVTLQGVSDAQLKRASAPVGGRQSSESRRSALRDQGDVTGRTSSYAADVTRASSYASFSRQWHWDGRNTSIPVDKLKSSPVRPSFEQELWYALTFFLKMIVMFPRKLLGVGEHTS